MRHRLAHRVGRSSQATTAAVDKPQRRLAHKISDTPRVSVEHVLNVLARLNAEPAPESAATALQVSTPPLANTERYDSLRTGNAATATNEEADHA